MKIIKFGSLERRAVCLDERAEPRQRDAVPDARVYLREVRLERLQEHADVAHGRLPLVLDRHLALLLRLAAIYGATLYALPAGMLERRALVHDLQPRRLIATLTEHPVVAVSAAAGLILGTIPLALPIEGSSVLLRGAGVALLLIGLPPLLTSRYVEATARAAVVTLSGALLLRASILGALDLFSSIAMASGFAALLLIGAAVAGQLTKAEE